jgi:hypothetical protein
MDEKNINIIFSICDYWCSFVVSLILFPLFSILFPDYYKAICAVAEPSPLI